MSRPRFLGVLLCYNDGDMLADTIEHLLENHHDVIAWDHGSTDETAAVLDRYRHELREATYVGRDVDFYDMYPLMSRHLMTHYMWQYDWISWPDQDEILEGPTRDQPYWQFLEEAVASPHGWIVFNDYVYWFTEADDPAIESPSQRVRHYSLARHGPIKVRAWRASCTNIRWFNHNKAHGTRVPALFNLRHYPMRSVAQMQRRLAVDRANLQHGPINYHYENMKSKSLAIRPDALHADDGRAELNPEMKFDWTNIYGTAPKLPRAVVDSFLISTKRWEIATVLKRALSKLPSTLVVDHGADRIGRWMDALDSKIANPVLVELKKDDVSIVTADMADRWTDEALEDYVEPAPVPGKRVETTLSGLPVAVDADATARRIRVAAGARDVAADTLPLLALVPCYGSEAARIGVFESGEVEFRELGGGYYFLTSEPQSLARSESADAAVRSSTP